MNNVNLMYLLAASAGVAGGLLIDAISSARKEKQLLRKNEIMHDRLNFILFTADKPLDEDARRHIQ